MNDIWEIFRVILDERKRREIDPTLEFLQETVSDSKYQAPEQPYVIGRAEDMLNFFETITAIYEQFEMIPTERLKDLVHVSNKLRSIVEQVSRE
jgi:DNA-binding transcriptional regulator GbsR (MarR family)